MGGPKRRKQPERYAPCVILFIRIEGLIPKETCFQNPLARGRLCGGHMGASSLRKLLKLVSEVSAVLNPNINTL
jgi:hypothetical protein